MINAILIILNFSMRMIVMVNHGSMSEIPLVVFMMIKAINRLKLKKEDEEKALNPPKDEILLLTEIRDLLKKNNQE